MIPIRSPLGALGALMVLLEGIAAAALVPLEGQPELQRMLVWLMIGVTSAITAVVIVVVLRFTFRNPGLLFSPRDINPEAHISLYSPGGSIPKPETDKLHGDISFEVSGERDF